MPKQTKEVKKPKAKASKVKPAPKGSTRTNKETASKKPVAKKPVSKKPAAKATPAKKTVKKADGDKKEKGAFKPSAWWLNASDARKKSYVLRHPKGNYAKLFAKDFKLDYDPKQGLDEKEIARVEVAHDPDMPDSGDPAKIKINMDDVPTLTDEVKEDEKPAEEEPEDKEPEAEKQIVREANIRSSAAERLKAGAKRVLGKIRDKLGPKAKEAEDALTDLKEGKSVDSKKMGSLGRTAKLMGVAALALLGGVAMFTPLAPVAINLGAEYIAYRFGNMSQSHSSDSDEVSELPGNLDEMFADMSKWLSSQDVDALADKLKENG